MMNKYDLLENYLDELLPNPVCELNYFNDYSLLIAIMLSAQTTDKRVNEVTKVLFSKYDIFSLAKCQPKAIEEIIKSCGTSKRKSLYISKIANSLVNKYNGKVVI
mgnify:CR=1 FL=1